MPLDQNHHAELGRMAVAAAMVEKDANQIVSELVSLNPDVARIVLGVLPFARAVELALKLAPVVLKDPETGVPIADDVEAWGSDAKGAMRKRNELFHHLWLDREADGSIHLENPRNASVRPVTVAELHELADELNRLAWMGSVLVADVGEAVRYESWPED